MCSESSYLHVTGILKNNKLKLKQTNDLAASKKSKDDNSAGKSELQQVRFEELRKLKNDVGVRSKKPKKTSKKPKKHQKSPKNGI